MRTPIALVLALVLVPAAGASAQTARSLRFTTNVGTFDMQLNPTGDENLQPLVDNIVAYVGMGAYHFTSINRAHENNAGTADDFVLQMGTFLAGPTDPALWAAIRTPISALSPVIVDSTGPNGVADGEPDFDTLPNVRGTVSLALGQGNPNSGTTSFFINLGDNSVGDNSLDAQGFIPFARINNMAPIDRIMRLSQRDLTTAAGVSSGNLAFKDVPVTAEDQIVFIDKVEVLTADDGFSFVGPIISALELVEARQAAQAASLATSSQASLVSQSAALQAAEELPPVAAAPATPPAGGTVVPEPSTVAISLAGMLATLLAARRRRAR